MTISQIRFWNDCGFTENCLEVPSKTNTLPSPSLIISEDSNPSKGNLFSQLRLKQPYTTLMNVSYLELTYDMNNGSDLTIYGWVDSVSVESDTSGFPLTVVDWHIDYWRTYLAQAEFGSGMVRRRFHDLGATFGTDSIPPQSYPYRYLQCVIDDVRTVYKKNIWWVFFNFTTSGETSSAFWKCFPVSNASPNQELQFAIGSSTGTAPSLNDVIIGRMDERLQVNPDSIGFAFISPFPPSSYTGTGTANDPIRLTNWSIWYDTTTGYNAYQSSGNPFYDVQTNFTSETQTAPETTDTDIYMLMDMMGNIVGTLPWGFAPVGARSRIVCDGTSACLVVKMYENTDYDGYEFASPAEGLTFTISLPAIPVTSNAWSSYVYSGSRQAEMDARQLQAESQAVSGGISTGTSAISGAVTGALLGSAGGPVGMVGGALVGALASAGTSLISTGANYAYQTGAYADEMQAISDYKASHQANNLILNGGSFDCCFNGIEGILIVHMRKDDYSLEQRSNDIILYGANVSEPMESCQDLVDEGGPLQISNLTVTGDIPVEAKTYFRARFSKGVRMLPGPEQTQPEEVSNE